MRCPRRPRLEVQQENHHCVPTHTSKAATHPATPFGIDQAWLRPCNPPDPRASRRPPAVSALRDSPPFCFFFFVRYPPLFSPPIGVFFAGERAPTSPAGERATACRSSTAVTSTASAIWPDNPSSRRLPPWGRKQTVQDNNTATQTFLSFNPSPEAHTGRAPGPPPHVSPLMVPSTAGHAPLPSSPPTRQGTPPPPTEWQTKHDLRGDWEPRAVRPHISPTNTAHTPTHIHPNVRSGGPPSVFIPVARPAAQKSPPSPIVPSWPMRTARPGTGQPPSDPPAQHNSPFWDPGVAFPPCPDAFAAIATPARPFFSTCV